MALQLPLLLPLAYVAVRASCPGGVGCWDLYRLHERRLDKEVFDPAARLLTPLLLACYLRPRALLSLAFVGLLALAALAALLLGTLGLLLSGRASRPSATAAQELLSFFHRHG